MTVRLLVVVLLGVSACATTSQADAYTGPGSCEQGAELPCAEWGEKLLREGDRPRAIEAYGKSCESGNLSSCMTEGRLRKEAGDYSGAEKPLRKVYETDDARAAEALAEVYEARGGVGDREAAKDMRHAAPALNKPATEVMYAFRATTQHGARGELSFNLQPMAFLDRRLGFGANVVLGGGRSAEFNGTFAYQHYVSDWLVPYGKLMLGKMQDGDYHAMNVGGEVGGKLCLEDIGHLNMALGVSRGSGGYFSIGIGINGIIALAILAQIR
ncbi:hypothetical protein NVS55_18190 [Myxococcus stipitatus]|uniref:tetratricopeptide repeat protein n=1 Tax=Myxococcus stipitatus TaxID=83455 RepID=UPI0031455471